MICSTSFADLARFAGQVSRSSRRPRAFAGRKISWLPLNNNWFLLPKSFVIVLVLVLLLVIDLLEVEFEHEHEHELGKKWEEEHKTHYCIGRGPGGP